MSIWATTNASLTGIDVVVGAAVEDVDVAVVVDVNVVVEVAPVEVVVFCSGSVGGTEAVPSVVSVEVVARIEVLVAGALVPGAVFAEESSSVPQLAIATTAAAARK